MHQMTYGGRKLRYALFRFSGSGYGVRVYFPDDLQQFRDIGTELGWAVIAQSALAVTWVYNKPKRRGQKIIAEVWIPRTSSQDTVVHEAVHAAVNNARLLRLTGDRREESIAHHAGEFSIWLLRRWRRKRKLTLSPRVTIVK